MTAISRRRFLQMTAGAALAGVIPAQAFQGDPPDNPQDPDFDWYTDSPLVQSMRLELEAAIGTRKMALDFRCFNRRQDELFRIQINAFDLYPVASCFKSMLVLYYFLTVPEAEWDADRFTPLYRMAVYSDNVATGTILDNVARRVEGPGNPIEKFNDFLRRTIGLLNGLHTWNWPGNPVRGFSDPRYMPSLSTGRVVWKNDVYHMVDNVFTAADLSRSHDFVVRGQHFSQIERFRRAARATIGLLSIPADNGYRSPIERVYPDGYMGKDGILPSDNLELGRVVNDAGAITLGGHTYIIAFMSAGESESTAIDVLRGVVRQMDVYEDASHGRW
jgi:hypothetical protein